MVDVRTRAQVWGQQYNRKLSELISLEEDLSHQITANLRVKLTGEDQKKLTKTYTDNNEAYQLYLKGLYYFDRRNPTNLNRAVECFNKAVELDPHFALAYAKSAHSYAMMSLPVFERKAKALSAVLKALELDVSLAQAHAALGMVKRAFEWDLEGAEKAYRRAIELNPNDSPIRNGYGSTLTFMGRFDEAISEMKMALALDPVSVNANRDLGIVYYNARMYDEAIDQLKKTLEMDQGNMLAHVYLAFAYEQKGQFNEAVKELIEYGKLEGFCDIEDAERLKAIYATRGWKGFLRKMLELELEWGRRMNLSMHWQAARMYVRLNEKNKALESLEKVYQERETLILRMLVDPMFDPLRSDPHFQDLIRRIWPARQ
jgi:Tfp pilus assembly protein PilF